MKNLSIMLIVVLVLLMLAGCSSNDNSTTPPDNSTQEDTQGNVEDNAEDTLYPDSPQSEPDSDTAYTVAFDSQGGTSLDSIVASSIDSMPVSTREGFNLAGWYSDAQSTTMVVFPYEVTLDTTLYAQGVQYTDGLVFSLAEQGYYVVDAGTALEGGNSDIVVPSFYNGVAVVGIADQAFIGDSITSVVLPYTVTSIGSWAFGGCSNLTSVTLPPQLDSIGMGAFFNNKMLADVLLPDSLVTISKSVFSNCTALDSIIIPDSVTYLGDSAFAYCSNLSSVVLSNNIDMLCDFVLASTNISSLVIPDGVTFVGDYALSNCASLTSLTLPASLQYITAFALSNCTSLDSVTFSNASGWYVTDSYQFVGGNSIDVSDSATNATRLSTTTGYYDYCWYRAD